MSTINVLDHGYVQTVGTMGTDETIIEAARMSTGRGFVSWDPYWRCKRSDCETVWGPDSKEVLELGCCRCGSELQHFPRGDLGLLERLWSSGHATPFEMCELAIEVKAPIMVFREWHRHRTQSYSEFSARYAVMPDEHYVPDPSRIQAQSATNKQGSGEALQGENASYIVSCLQDEQAMIYAHYEDLVGKGVAREVARINTPISRYSKMRAKANLRNWLGFLALRLHPTAQWEIRQYAQVVASIVKERWPRTWSLFEEHTLNAVKLSSSEVKLLADSMRKNETPNNEPGYWRLFDKIVAAAK